jgi:hypothetical protein
MVQGVDERGKRRYDNGMKNEIASFLLIPADPKLAGIGSLWEEFRTLEAAEDAQDEYAGRGLNYDLVPVLA